MQKFKDFASIRMDVGENRYVVIEPLKDQDVAYVANMYRQIAITDRNYREKLNPESENNFGNTGGMFLISDEQELEQVCRSPKELMLVARENGGDIKGIIWYSADETNYHLVDEIILNCEEDVRECWRKEHEGGRMVYGKEIIAVADRTIKDLPTQLFFTMLQHLYDCGYTYSTGEVYRTRYYKVGNEVIPCDLLNNRSFKTLQRSGGQHVGVLKDREIELTWYTVCIQSQVFIWNIAAAVKKYKEETKKP